MKKFVKLFVLCGLLALFASGCADVAEGSRPEEDSKERMTVCSAQVVETAAPIEEGYYMVEGSLCELGKNELFLKTEEGQDLYFKLAPETIIYAGDNREIAEGQKIKVVFDGTLTESKMEDVSVIAVTALEE